jgi:hypothetical protein
MDLQASKIELVKEILNIESPSLIHRVFDLLKTEEREIEIAIEQLDRGEGIKWEDFMKSIS